MPLSNLNSRRRYCEFLIGRQAWWSIFNSKTLFRASSSAAATAAKKQESSTFKHNINFASLEVAAKAVAMGTSGSNTDNAVQVLRQYNFNISLGVAANWWGWQWIVSVIVSVQDLLQYSFNMIIALFHTFCYCVKEAVLD